MILQWTSAIVGLACLAGAGAWARAAWVHQRFLQRVQRHDAHAPMATLAAATVRRDVADVISCLVLASIAAVALSTDDSTLRVVVLAASVPATFALISLRWIRPNTRLAEERFELEHRATELLEQAENAPNRWAERLTPRELPDTPGYQLGKVHQAGTGVMSGDLMDVFYLPGGRLCCVMGDAAGHGVEASMSALQTKFLLRTYLRRFRDPGQALEELNQQLMDFERPEDFVSMCVVVFDPAAGVARYASAGHPAAWHYRDRSIVALRSTGPILMMDSAAEYLSRDVDIEPGDTMVLLTDGLLEARNGSDMFGDERAAAVIRRSSQLEPDVLCKSLLDAATDFCSSRMTDDVTVMAIQRLGP